MYDRASQVARHALARDALLLSLEDVLCHDERFVAAWLTGSFGRGEDDALSDIDITVVVEDLCAEQLCTRHRDVGAGTTPERLALIRRFGEPLLIHENHFNAPAGGSFTHVVYADSVVAVDWTLIARSRAIQPADTRLLFDRAGVPRAELPALTATELAERLSERVAFFWMVAFPAMKSLLRGDHVRFQQQLEMLERTRLDTQRLLAGELPRYRRDSMTQLLESDVRRRTALRAACAAMVELAPAVIANGGRVPDAPLEAVDALLGPDEHDNTHDTTRI